MEQHLSTALGLTSGATCLLAVRGCDVRGRVFIARRSLLLHPQCDKATPMSPVPKVQKSRLDKNSSVRAFTGANWTPSFQIRNPASNWVSLSYVVLLAHINYIIHSSGSHDILIHICYVFLIISTPLTLSLPLPFPLTPFLSSSGPSVSFMPLPFGDPVCFTLTGA